MARKKKSSQSQLVVEVVAPEPQGTPTTPEELLEFASQALERIQDAQERYGVEEIPERILDRLEKIKSAHSKEKGELLATKAYKAFEMHCLALWANGKIQGVLTKYTVAKKIKQYEALAKFLKSRGMEEQAKKQLEKAEQYRQIELTSPVQ